MRKYNRCINCNKLIAPQAKRCNHCAGIKKRKYQDRENMPSSVKRSYKYWASHSKQCLDCSKIINQHAIRCSQCDAKRRVKSQNDGHGNNWKGGIYSHGGYTFIRNPSHQKADQRGYVLEHYLVWEESHAEPLPQGWVIHHLNGIKSDNRPVNLVALSTHQHAQVLAVKAKRIRELEAILHEQGQLI